MNWPECWSHVVAWFDVAVELADYAIVVAVAAAVAAVANAALDVAVASVADDVSPNLLMSPTIHRVPND